MATTRHHINSLRRRQARESVRTRGPGTATATRAGRATATDSPAGASGAVGPARTRTAVRPARDAPPDPVDATARRTRNDRRSRPVGLVLCCLLTVVLGGFAGWAHARAEGLREDPAVRNTALTDVARTSEIKGQTAKAVAALFSYDHADPGAFEEAAKNLLTGRAVEQHRALLGDVRAGAERQKAVITTTVTDSAVERIDGDRARVLVYADQAGVSTAGGEDASAPRDRQAKDAKEKQGTKGAKGARKDERAKDTGTYAGAMFAVDVVRRDGRWLVSGIDTFGR
ncbi:hypothetical protein [Streptomyces sp. AC627_RSS907]|uniref:hypothetical protein n=1 Tax=Streptomyces sp. AC627_RSS907 TaxID=2823684 RepID=UPI001C229888|nr:hypothetical protein [Streptomyces sp. AC627_RSS907]